MVIPKGKFGKEKNSRGRLFHIFLPIHLLLIREKTYAINCMGGLRTAPMRLLQKSFVKGGQGPLMKNVPRSSPQNHFCNSLKLPNANPNLGGNGVPSPDSRTEEKL